MVAKFEARSFCIAVDTIHSYWLSWDSYHSKSVLAIFPGQAIEGIDL